MHEVTISRTVVKIRPDISLLGTAPLRVIHTWLFDTPHASPQLRSEIMSTGGDGLGTLKDNFALMPRVLASTYFGAHQAMDMCIPLPVLERSCFHAFLGSEVPTECILTHYVRHVQRIPELPRSERTNESEARFRMIRGDGSFRILGGWSGGFKAYW